MFDITSKNIYALHLLSLQWYLFTTMNESTKQRCFVIFFPSNLPDIFMTKVFITTIIYLFITKVIKLNIFSGKLSKNQLTKAISMMAVISRYIIYNIYISLYPVYDLLHSPHYAPTSSVLSAIFAGELIAFEQTGLTKVFPSASASSAALPEAM